MGFIYVLVTVVFLWPAMLPWSVHKHVQSLDSALTALISAHTARAMVGQAPFWDMEIFYPYPNTLCLSEPMITPALITGPVLWLFGPIVAQNLYLYFCWWATAFAMWGFLRNRGVCAVAAFWGGFVASFSPDRLWHLGGHVQLLFQAGFPLVLLAMERAFGGAKRGRWIALFCGAFILQMLASFYLALMFIMWCTVLVPCSAWVGAEGRKDAFWKGARRVAPCGLLAIVFTAAVMLPISMRYSRYARDIDQHSLDRLANFSATIPGYLVPAAESRGTVTATGALMRKVWPQFTKPRGENIQYVGFSVLFLVCLAAIFGGRHSRQPRLLRKSDSGGTAPHAGAAAHRIFSLGLVLLLLIAFGLSLGPYAGGLSREGTPVGAPLPFAYIHALFPSLRFMRVPARFSFIVQFCMAIMGAYGFHVLWRAIAARWSVKVAAVVTGLLLCCTIGEYLPVERKVQLPASPDAFSKYLMQEKKAAPYVEVSARNYGRTLVQQAHHGVPTANGYSGYFPEHSLAEMLWFQDNFPSAQSLMLFERWGIDRVLVRSDTHPLQKQLAGESAALARVWAGAEGIFYRLQKAPQPYALYLQEQRARAGVAPGAIAPPLRFVSNFRHVHAGWKHTPTAVPVVPTPERPYPAFLTSSVHSPFYVDLRQLPLLPSLYTRLVLRVAIDNWFSTKEHGAIYWNTSVSQEWSLSRAVRFPIKADGNAHDIEVDLGQQIAWTASEPIVLLRIDIGDRAGNMVVVETAQLEQGDASAWVLPPRRVAGKKSASD